jgi:uncharacterized protein YecT (DUF1311 family)
MLGNLPDEFHPSPDEDWIFAPHHVGSCLREGELFHRAGPANLEDLQDFDSRMWKSAVALGEFARDFAAEGQCHMVDFDGWSEDSSRLLLAVRGGEEKRAMKHRRIYFNTRTSAFELTGYIRKLNTAKGEMLACAEPLDPLPIESELKTRYELLDRQLNSRYAEVFAQAGDRSRVLRDAQRDWLKSRDEGLKVYLSAFPAAEKQQRRLQFLCDVTAARMDTPAEQWEL